MNEQFKDESHESYISKEELFMSMSQMVSRRSRDPCTGVGAVIVKNDEKVVGVGYNGMPRGFPNEKGHWGKSSENPLDNKYLYVVHAEAYAIINSSETEGCTMYTTLFPCNECSKVIVSNKIKTIVYGNKSNNHKYKDSYIASELILKHANVEVVEYSGRRSFNIEL